MFLGNFSIIGDGYSTLLTISDHHLWWGRCEIAIIMYLIIVYQRESPTVRNIPNHCVSLFNRTNQLLEPLPILGYTLGVTLVDYLLCCWILDHWHWWLSLLNGEGTVPGLDISYPHKQDHFVEKQDKCDSERSNSIPLLADVQWFQGISTADSPGFVF